jgi:methyl-accepting chemotaxis protein
MNTGVGSIIRPLTQSSKRKCGLKSDTEELKHYTDDIIGHVEQAGNVAEEASASAQNVEEQVAEIGRAIYSMPQTRCHFEPPEACAYDSGELQEAVDHLGSRLQDIDDRLEEVLGVPAISPLTDIAEDILATVNAIKERLDDFEGTSDALEKIQESLDRLEERLNDLKGGSEDVRRSKPKRK